jgi:hypothetical protein
LGNITTNYLLSTNYSIATNYLIGSFPIQTISDLFISGSVLNITNGIGVTLTGANNGATNIVNALMLGVNLQSTRMQGNSVLGSLASTNVLGVGSLGAGVVVTNSRLTNLLIASIPTPGESGGILNTQLVNIINNKIFNRTNSGINVQITNVLDLTIANIVNWQAVASSADGSHLAAADNGGFIFISTNSGATWFATGAPGTNWSALAMSADGSQLTAAVNGGLIYSSTDSGASWFPDNVPASNWRAVATSASGADLVAVVYGGVLYTEQSPASPPVPALQINVANGNVVLNWTAGANNIVLQQSSNNMGTVWQDLPTTPIVINGQNQVTLPISTGPCLYRLKQP